MWGINVKAWNTISSIKEKTGDSEDCEATVRRVHTVCVCEACTYVCVCVCEVCVCGCV